MACDVFKIDGDLLFVRLSGVLHLAEQQAAQDVAAEVIARHGQARVLAIAENFQGWAKREDWNDMGFLIEHGDDVVKIAIVGDEPWREDAYAFAGKGFRETEVEFFLADALPEAERWVRG